MAFKTTNEKKYYFWTFSSADISFGKCFKFKGIMSHYALIYNTFESNFWDLKLLPEIDDEESKVDDIP